MNYKTLLNYVSDEFSQHEISEEKTEQFKLYINKDSIISVLKEILLNDELANKIASRSYSHTLGFDKIVLVDLSKDIGTLLPKVQLRLHIWEPDNDSVPIVESLHEHSFDFISHVLTGKLENQIFKIEDLTDDLKSIIKKIKVIYKSLSTEDKSFINNQVEIIEAINLSENGSFQLNDLNMLEDFYIDKLTKLTGLTTSECLKLRFIQGRYVSNRVGGENKAYKHLYEGSKKVGLKAVEHHSNGGYYFHSHVYPHRLYYDNSIINSTILITTPTPLNPQGGSFQRPTYIESDEINYDKLKIDLSKFKANLNNLINILEKE
jgi:hypothetical protein